MSVGERKENSKVTWGLGSTTIIKFCLNIKFVIHEKELASLH